MFVNCFVPNLLFGTAENSRRLYAMNNVTGERIEQLRKENGLTQAELAAKMHVKRETIFQWEANTRQIKSEAVKALSAEFRVTSDYLLGLSNHRTQESANITAEKMGIGGEAAKRLVEMRECYLTRPEDFSFLSEIEPDNAILALKTLNDYIKTVETTRQKFHKEKLQIADSDYFSLILAVSREIESAKKPIIDRLNKILNKIAHIPEFDKELKAFNESHCKKASNHD